MPLSFDFPSKTVQEVCLPRYDPAKANGELPLVNSITEHRWDLMELYGEYRFKVDPDGLRAGREWMAYAPRATRPPTRSTAPRAAARCA